MPRHVQPKKMRNKQKYLIIFGCAVLVAAVMRNVLDVVLGGPGWRELQLTLADLSLHELSKIHKWEDLQQEKKFNGKFTAGIAGTQVQRHAPLNVTFSGTILADNSGCVMESGINDRVLANECTCVCILSRFSCMPAATCACTYSPRRRYPQTHHIFIISEGTDEYPTTHPHPPPNTNKHLVGAHGSQKQVLYICPCCLVRACLCVSVRLHLLSTSLSCPNGPCANVTSQTEIAKGHLES
jgi:hypothetical protein